MLMGNNSHDIRNNRDIHDTNCMGTSRNNNDDDKDSTSYTMDFPSLH